MKNLHKLAAAMSLALLAGNASAALNDGNTLGTPGSVVFSIEDTVTKKTFFLDLALGGHTGLDYGSFVNKAQGASGTLSWDLSALGGTSFDSFKPNTANFNWSVVGGYNTFAENLVASPGVTQWGALSTGTNASVFAQQVGARIQAEVDPTGKIGGWPARLNDPSAAPGANVGSIDPINGNSLYSIYLANVGQLTDSAGAPSFKGATTADFFWITNPGLDQQINNQITKLGSFSLGANNVLTFNAAGVSQVPVPAAVWLFGSALTGLMGINRRKKAVLTA